MTEPAQLPDNINDLEKQSYKRDGDGNTALRVSHALVDNDGNKGVIDSDTKRLQVHDQEVEDILNRVLTTLEQINLKLGMITDSEGEEF